MNKFLEKVLKFLTKFKFFRFESRKFLEFLLGLFGGEKGDIIEEIQGKCNNIVHTILVSNVQYYNKVCISIQ